jgi:hypothetical protein
MIEPMAAPASFFAAGIVAQKGRAVAAATFSISLIGHGFPPDRVRAEASGRR